MASLAPDASDLEVHQVTESVEPASVQSQIDALENYAFRLYRSDMTRSSDSATSLLKRLGVTDPAAAAYLRTDSIARQALARAGRNVIAEVSDSNDLLKLSVRWSKDDTATFQRVVMEKSASGFTTKVETAPLVATARLASGTIQTSLFAATDDARIPDPVASQLVDMFATDIDFHRALRKGDRFSVVYEVLEGDGESMRSGRVLSAEFVNNGKTHQAMWFQDPTLAGGDPTAKAKGSYYTLDGQSLKRGFLASPMAFSRITSTFKMRFHPILNKWIAHQGVDYAAPTGTPVRSVGDGVVEFAGVQNGYGNVVYIGHRDHRTTVYAHLSRIDVKRGESVTQSEVIGEVGSTGWATGPHLHFELRINGVYHDPLTVAQQIDASPLSASAKPLFDRLAANAKVQLAAAASIQQTRTQ